MTDRATGPQVRIRDLRNAYGLTLVQLAQRIRSQGVDVHADHVGNVELGYKRASPTLLHAWASALRVNPLDVWQPPSSPLQETDDAA